MADTVHLFCRRRYCRIVAADVLALLAARPGGAARIAAAGAAQPLLRLLRLQHAPGVRPSPWLLLLLHPALCKLLDSCARSPNAQGELR